MFHLHQVYTQTVCLTDPYNPHTPHWTIGEPVGHVKKSILDYAFVLEAHSISFHVHLELNWKWNILHNWRYANTWLYEDILNPASNVLYENKVNSINLIYITNYIMHHCAYFYILRTLGILLSFYEPFNIIYTVTWTLMKSATFYLGIYVSVF